MLQVPQLSPAPLPWQSGEALFCYAQQCLRELGLGHWDFGWDRAIQRLGCCNMSRQRITLSKHFVGHYMGRDDQLILETLLHELAHALAWEQHRSRGHGEVWRHYCGQLGIAQAQRCTACDNFHPSPARYALIIADTGEVIRHYSRRPQLSKAKLKRSYIPKRKEETLGKLKLVELNAPCKA